MFIMFSTEATMTVVNSDPWTLGEVPRSEDDFKLWVNDSRDVTESGASQSDC